MEPKVKQFTPSTGWRAGYVVDDSDHAGFMNVVGFAVFDDGTVEAMVSSDEEGCDDHGTIVVARHFVPTWARYFDEEHAFVGLLAPDATAEDVENLQDAAKRKVANQEELRAKDDDAERRAVLSKRLGRELPEGYGNSFASFFGWPIDRPYPTDDVLRCYLSALDAINRRGA